METLFWIYVVLISNLCVFFLGALCLDVMKGEKKEPCDCSDILFKDENLTLRKNDKGGMTSFFQDLTIVEGTEAYKNIINKYDPLNKNK